ncbi:MAG: hypothetical protein ACRD4F_18945, partial [Candidatus Angelobacter sp.]
GILYAIFGALITAIQADRISDLFSFMGFFTGTIDSTLLGLISIFYALAMMLIPFIARRIISGDVGASAFGLVRAAAITVGAAVSAGAGFAAGAGAGASSAGAGSGATAGEGVAMANAGAMSSSMPPPQPSLAETIRSGMMSAVSGGPPPAPAASSNNAPEAGASRGSDAAAQSSRGSNHGFRPVGTVQTVAFHAARMAGGALRGAATGAESENSR